MAKQFREDRSLSETPTWAVATVTTVMVAFGFFVQTYLKQFGKWLDRTKRKSLFAALEKIKEELMLFGVLSLLMGHWIVVVAKICVKSSALNSRFFTCASEKLKLGSDNDALVSMSESLNKTRGLGKHFRAHDYCSEGHESLASYDSLEQLHRLIFVLGVTHILYSFAAIAFAMLKIYSWRVWENEAKAIANQSLEDVPHGLPHCPRMRRMSTFIAHHTSHAWSQHKILVWLLCFSRQFWSSINRSDYMALRLGFITTHQLPLSYDFHKYMLRSIEEEFCDIVGISIPLWIYTICCIFLDFHGSNIYFWLSFLPAILILIIGTKLHHVVVKLAVEIMGNYVYMDNQQFKLRDELFWFRSPRLLLRLVQLISFQNAFEMATFLWSLWEIKGTSCFMDNRRFLVIRLTFGVISQFWCSFITFPLYVIITQMGSRFKKTMVTENVRRQLSGWHRRVKARHATSTTTPLLRSETVSLSDSVGTEMHMIIPTQFESSATFSCQESSPESEQAGQASFEIVPLDEEMPSQFSNIDYTSSDTEMRRRSVISHDHDTLP